ncbi:Flavohemoprotein (Hemoglobin-like protein) (Flavohemoglobin) (Nitric oxide dioxygenase) [Marinobacterium lacunae]|uniref:Flavohemoprotein n=1 Tax=Marinobacterium lacunae TaxID=1232683 RepID=A0A081FVM4_9GAMM|nr:NO-inducible flavohemoprotein [Marinobacterium lacunae]KEA62579.1 Flavohemoprotein (Hemoglobin-like protein) (Flavohemoglobin) (Nitric oxide dioxygenase) [Marinobacterium lacunae]
MLSDQTREIVAATLPAVKEKARDITEVFYPLMFTRYPQVKAYFNQAHQSQGTQRQALANAVVAYAANLDRLELLGDAVSLIVHKHASLNILPEQYPIVGECLLAAIKEVLGEAATDAVLNAWGEAYQQLADILITAEEGVYRTNEAKTGGWRGEREFVLVGKTRESEVITSFYFEPVDGQPVAAFKPGQYTTIILEIDGQTTRRNYSLSDTPDKPYYRISVKREAGGLVSNHLHDNLNPGDIVRLTPPCGDFVLNESDRPLVLLSGGVGLTPTLSMLRPALAQGREVHFIHGALNSATHAFKSDVDSLKDEFDNLHVSYCYSEPLPHDHAIPSGMFDQARLASLLPLEKSPDVYFLGPRPFMQSCYQSLSALNVPKERIRFEFFGPLEELAGAVA